MYSLFPKKCSLALGVFYLVLLIWLLILKMQTLLSRVSKLLLNYGPDFTEFSSSVLRARSPS